MKTAVKTLLAVVALTMCVAAPAVATAAEPGDRLDAARLLIFDRDWPKAVAELRRVLRDPKEPLRDEASYWLAQSLFQMARASEALEVIEAMERDHPRSRWVLPAQSLRVQIAASTDRVDLLWRVAVAPPPPVPPPPPAPRLAPTPLMARPAEAPAPPGPPAPPKAPTRAPSAPLPLTMTDVRIEALSGLLVRDPARAVPVLREIVVDEVETPQARRALFVLGLSPHQDARETVMHFARTGPENLRVVAVEQMGRWRTYNVRFALMSVYQTSSGRVKLEVLRSLGETKADAELIRIARAETNPDLRGYAIAQLRQIDTEPARAFLRTVK